jgi:hypothetical protein
MTSLNTSHKTVVCPDKQGKSFVETVVNNRSIDVLLCEHLLIEFAGQ